jgi:NADPH2:quinone reductase
VPAAQLLKLPDSVDFQTAAAAMLQGMTAHYLTHSTFPIEPGHTALVHAAAGGTGRLLSQMVKLRGGRVIGTAGTREKAEVARAAGADDVILYREQDLVAEVKRFTDGKGVDVVYDGVGEATFMQSLDSLKLRGMMALFGQASGPVKPFDPLLLMTKGALFLTRPTLANYASPDELKWRSGDVLGWILNKKLQLLTERVYPLADAAQAHRDLESRKTMGKLVLTI